MPGEFRVSTFSSPFFLMRSKSVGGSMQALKNKQVVKNIKKRNPLILKIPHFVITVGYHG